MMTGHKIKYWEGSAGWRDGEAFDTIDAAVDHLHHKFGKNIWIGWFDGEGAPVYRSSDLILLAKIVWT